MAKGRLQISSAVLDKLKNKHGVTVDEIKQCFVNRDGGFLEDTREGRQTHPPTKWFIAETNRLKKLKVVFIVTDTEDGKAVEIKTAYEPNAEEIDIYERFGK